MRTCGSHTPLPGIKGLPLMSARGKAAHAPPGRREVTAAACAKRSTCLLEMGVIADSRRERRSFHEGGVERAPPDQNVLKTSTWKVLPNGFALISSNAVVPVSTVGGSLSVMF